MSRSLSRSGGNQQHGRKVSCFLSRNPTLGWMGLAISQALVSVTMGIFFFKNPNPVLPTDAGQLPVALTASIRRTTRGLVGHQEGCQPRAPRTPRLFHGESAPKTASVWLHLHFLPRGHKYCEATPGLIGPLFCLPLFCLFPQPHFCAGQTLCYVGQNGSFLAGKRKSLVSVASLFPFFGVTSGLLFGLPFWWFLGDLIRASGTALLGILDCLSEGCNDVGMSSLDWGHPSPGPPGITKLSRGWT